MTRQLNYFLITAISIILLPSIGITTRAQDYQKIIDLNADARTI